MFCTSSAPISFLFSLLFREQSGAGRFTEEIWTNDPPPHPFVMIPILLCCSRCVPARVGPLGKFRILEAPVWGKGVAEVRLSDWLRWIARGRLLLFELNSADACIESLMTVSAIWNYGKKYPTMLILYCLTMRRWVKHEMGESTDLLIGWTTWARPNCLIFPNPNPKIHFVAILAEVAVGKKNETN